MQLPVQITFRNMGHSDAVEARVRERAEKLDRFSDNIMSCRVVVEAPHKHQHKGGIYVVHIDLTLPNKEVTVSRAPGLNHAHEDVYVAIRDAFDAAQRQLEDHERRRRGDVKAHEVAPHGRIVELLPAQDYGWIESSDGRSIYFHRNSVMEADFDELKVGALVHFSEEMGDNGPQATTVHVEGKHHVRG